MLCGALLAAAALGALPAAAQSRVRFSAQAPAAGLFPSDVFTEFEPAGVTQLRVALPKPDCARDAAGCALIDELNQLDGFNLQPRLVLPFSGPIDPATLSSSSVFLIALGDAQGGPPPSSERIGVSQLVLNPAANTAFAESDALLEQHSRYALIVTTELRDARGAPLAALDAAQLQQQIAAARPGRDDLRAGIERALARARALGVPPERIAGLSVFTTQSITGALEGIRAQLEAARAQPLRMAAAASGERALFALPDVQELRLVPQIGTGPSFDSFALRIDRLRSPAGAIARIGFGSYRSPNFLRDDVTLPPLRERGARPAAQGPLAEVGFTVFLPAGRAPAGGWPVAVFGHSFGSSKDEGALELAPMLAASGVATLAINALGHGGGPESTIALLRRAGGAPLVLAAGGRSRDLNGDGLIGGTEGSTALTAVGQRDALRQTAADLMQLARALRAGADVDGDGRRDLDPERISYVGQAFGGMYGTLMLAVDPMVEVGVLNATGGSLAEVGRLATAEGQALLPLRGSAVPPLVTDKPAVLAAQETLDRQEWLGQAGDPLAHAAQLRLRPLAGVPAKRILFQFARGDATVANPTSSALLRAGALRDAATLLRADRVAPLDPRGELSNPHRFLSRSDSDVEVIARVARQAQQQVATFVASRGRSAPDPDGAGLLFETPIQGELPEDLGLLPPPPPPPVN